MHMNNWMSMYEVQLIKYIIDVINEDKQAIVLT